MRNRIFRFTIYAGVGVATGLIVAGVVVLAEKVLLEAVLHRSLLQQACAPGLGLWIAVLVIPTILVINIGVIAREERYLEQKFGEEYLAYKAAVRRWV